MWHGLSMIWLAFAVSLDSFGAGNTYGMRKIRIPFLSTVIIACCSGGVIFGSMKAGGWLAGWLSPGIASMIGALILIVLGCWTLYQGFINANHPEPLPGEAAVSKHKGTNGIKVWTFELKTIGLVIQILKTPMAADMDRSGSISPIEAVLLGAALSLDAFGAGLAAVMIGLPPASVALLIAGMSALFLRLGMWMGFRCVNKIRSPILHYLPGIFLVLLGLMRFF
ncbi:sporulation membrane protein YtaF [Paenactinomyces guangxiensis]|uniref:Sporulation membrane protein YtaF n=1 Tax=Paenactinomyces guangxiensis TaxID=1490290 RepID=A0A7W1WUU5_9BACL|nr:sporulation membrane protein YtaF [Paenactinomyces guangxiensis]MBA4496463.1 sporulation membrane protein YtaF [Paenactinomyces guangxiensis]MBH8593579.1 sporulation membrane protein YtaF [Paenactinomyces guangxiensis]